MENIDDYDLEKTIENEITNLIRMKALCKDDKKKTEWLDYLIDNITEFYDKLNYYSIYENYLLECNNLFTN